MMSMDIDQERTFIFNALTEIHENCLDGMDIFTALDLWIEDNIRTISDRKYWRATLEHYYFKVYGINHDEECRDEDETN